MFSLLNRFKELLSVALLLVYPLISFLWWGHKGREPNLADRVVLAVSSPLQDALTHTLHGFASSVNGYIALRGSHEEAQACRVELSESHAELNALKEAQAENVRLKALLAYSEGSVEPEIAARVIGVNASPHFISLRLGRGESDGVHVGMPVVTASGVVGQVARAVGGSADVMLITDPGSRIGAVVQRSRVRASVVGAGGGETLVLKHVLRSDDVIDGDIVITSGTDGVFPAGLVLGKVEGVRAEPTGMFKIARVGAAADLRRLEEVLVLPPVSSLPTAQTFLPSGKAR